MAKSVDAMQKHHAKVLAMCGMLDEACMKADANGVKVCECCLTVAKELDAAGKEADKVRELLKIAPLKDPTHDHHEGAKK